MSNTTSLYLLTALLGVSLGLESVYDAATALGVLQLACALAMCYFGYCTPRAATPGAGSGGKEERCGQAFLIR